MCFAETADSAGVNRSKRNAYKKDFIEQVNGTDLFGGG